MTYKTVTFIALGSAILVMFVLNLLWGAVHIPVRTVMQIIAGDDTVNATWRFIVLQFRLPLALTALLAGGALAVCGLLMQAVFKNPLADPSILGVSSGAGLGVAVVMLFFGGGLVVDGLSVAGFMAAILAALMGAIAVTLLMLVISNIVGNSSLLLIAGVMVGYLTSSLIMLLNFSATDDGLRSYMYWGMGNFSSVSLKLQPMFSLVIAASMAISLLLIKSLNLNILGDKYAQNLGVNTRRLRTSVLLLTGIMTAVVTAFCGPIAFIGLAAPHISRLLFRTDDYRVLLPATVFVGSNVALLCSLLCTLPSNGTLIPVNAVTPFVGVPVILYIMLRKNKSL